MARYEDEQYARGSETPRVRYERLVSHAANYLLGIERAIVKSLRSQGVEVSEFEGAEVIFTRVAREHPDALWRSIEPVRPALTEGIRAWFARQPLPDADKDAVLSNPDFRHLEKAVETLGRTHNPEQFAKAFGEAYDLTSIDRKVGKKILDMPSDMFRRDN